MLSIIKTYFTITDPMSGLEPLSVSESSDSGNIRSPRDEDEDPETPDCPENPDRPEHPEGIIVQCATQ